MRKVSIKPLKRYKKRQNKTRHRLQPVSGTKDDLLRIVSKVYFKSKPTIRQRIKGWLG